MNDILGYIDRVTINFFIENKKNLVNFDEANLLMKRKCGINSFFSNIPEIDLLFQKIDEINRDVVSENRREYGDFQTNSNLANQVVEYVYEQNSNIEFILEPTCGKGNFIISVLKHFKSLKKIVGIEIHQPYVWETKFKILSHFLINDNISIPDIDIYNENIFNFSFNNLIKSTKDLKTLIIGNPPWVTNSELGSISSANLPNKRNFKEFSGLDAITGKGNFDIGEYISLILIKAFQNNKGIFAFLIKNSVIKNIIFEQKRNKFKISNCEKLTIDAKKEFNVSVNASLFIATLNDNSSSLICNESSFYNQNNLTTFGWYKDKFVNSIKDYDETSIIDGKSIFIWRSGVKHDCSKIMELEPINGHFINALKQEVKLENNLVYGLLKSSDLKGERINSYRKVTIITQNKIGQETGYIKDVYPLTYSYLSVNIDHFLKRKSSIYIGKPNFSIFGIGNYSFSMYKIAISGLYKSTHFTLVEPSDNKPIMLDDTCYFIGFDKLIFAKIIYYLLNSEFVQRFLSSIIFSDEKRSINKDILMRIDFNKIFEKTSFDLAKNSIEHLTIDDWKEFEKLLNNKLDNKQLKLF